MQILDFVDKNDLKGFQQRLKDIFLQKDSYGSLLDMLIKRYTDPQLFRPFFEAVLRCQPNLNWFQSKDQKSLLMIACEMGRPDAVRLLLNQKGLNLKQTDGNSKNAVFYVLSSRWPHGKGQEILKQLLEIDSTLVDSHTPITSVLHEAVKSGKRNYVQILLQYGANPNIALKIDERTPIFDAVKLTSTVKQKEIVQLLIHWKANCRHENSHSKRPSDLVKAKDSELFAILKKAEDNLPSNVLNESPPNSVEPILGKLGVPQRPVRIQQKPNNIHQILTINVPTRPKNTSTTGQQIDYNHFDESINIHNRNRDRFDTNHTPKKKQNLTMIVSKTFEKQDTLRNDNPFLQKDLPNRKQAAKKKYVSKEEDAIGQATLNNQSLVKKEPHKNQDTPINYDTNQQIKVVPSRDTFQPAQFETISKGKSLEMVANTKLKAKKCETQVVPLLSPTLPYSPPTKWFLSCNNAQHKLNVYKQIGEQLYQQQVSLEAVQTECNRFLIDYTHLLQSQAIGIIISMPWEVEEWLPGDDIELIAFDMVSCFPVSKEKLDDFVSKVCSKTGIKVDKSERNKSTVIILPADRYLLCRRIKFTPGFIDKSFEIIQWLHQLEHQINFRSLFLFLKQLFTEYNFVSPACRGMTNSAILQLLLCFFRFCRDIGIFVPKETVSVYFIEIYDYFSQPSNRCNVESSHLFYTWFNGLHQSQLVDLVKLKNIIRVLRAGLQIEIDGSYITYLKQLKHIIPINDSLSLHE